jgi:hypothetical protein
LLILNKDVRNNVTGGTAAAAGNDEGKWEKAACSCNQTTGEKAFETTGQFRILELEPALGQVLRDRPAAGK